MRMTRNLASWCMVALLAACGGGGGGSGGLSLSSGGSAKSEVAAGKTLGVDARNGSYRVYAANGTQPVDALPDPPPVEETIQPLPPVVGSILVLATPVLLVGSFVYFFWRFRPRE